VGAYARFALAWDSLNQGEAEKAKALFDELKTNFPDALDNQGNLLLSNNRLKFFQKMTQDWKQYTKTQIQEAERLMGVADKKYGTPEGKAAVQEMVQKFPGLNRTGCAMLYLATMSKGEERTRYFQECIDKYNDCFYGDGVQVGAYARFLLAQDYQQRGQTEKAKALVDELKANYPDAIDHEGNLLLDNYGDAFISKQTKDAESGNRWAEYNLWDAYCNGSHDVDKNPTEADQWLQKFVKDIYLVRFGPADGFHPKNAMDYLNSIHKCTPQVQSARNSLGVAGFFRTTKQDNQLVGSNLSEQPDVLKACIKKNPDLKFISSEPVTPESFTSYIKTKQQSL